MWAVSLCRKDEWTQGQKQRGALLSVHVVRCWLMMVQEKMAAVRMLSPISFHRLQNESCLSSCPVWGQPVVRQCSTELVVMPRGNPGEDFACAFSAFLLLVLHHAEARPLHRHLFTIFVLCPHFDPTISQVVMVCLEITQALGMLCLPPVSNVPGVSSPKLSWLWSVCSKEHS